MKLLQDQARIEVRDNSGKWVLAHWEQLEQGDIVRVLPAETSHEDTQLLAFVVVAPASLQLETLSDFNARAAAALAAETQGTVVDAAAEEPSTKRKPRARRAIKKDQQ